jgi:transcriptional regulator of acetoin/glycerol metabolism
MSMSRVMVRRPAPTDLRAKHADQVHFVVQGQPAEPTSAEVSSSWQRSAHLHHVDPDSREAPRILTSREVSERREPLDQLIFSAQDELDRLYKVVREAGYTLLF